MYQRSLLLFLLGGFLLPGLRHVSGISIYTTNWMQAVKGTDVKLKCLFKSSHPVSPESVSVAWFYQPLHRGREKVVFYYNKKPYPPTEGRFRKRVLWSGDVMNNDASITLRRVSPKFNGTYACEVRNVPDVSGRRGEVVLTVINKTESLDLFTALFDLMGV